MPDLSLPGGVPVRWSPTERLTFFQRRAVLAGALIGLRRVPVWAVVALPLGFWLVATPDWLGMASMLFAAAFFVGLGVLLAIFRETNREDLPAFPRWVLASAGACIALAALGKCMAVVVVPLAILRLHRWLRGTNVVASGRAIRAAWAYGALVEPWHAGLAARVLSTWETVMVRTGGSEVVTERHRVFSPAAGAMGNVFGTWSHEDVSKDRPPMLDVMRSTDRGLLLGFTVPVGYDPNRYEQSPAYAASWAVREVQVGHPETHRVSMLLVTGADPLAAPVPAGSIVPACSPSLSEGLPVAVAESGRPLSVAPVHSLIIGGTGSGKGSMLWGYVNAFRSTGCVRFWGVDPKMSEVRAAEGLFCRVAYDPDDIAALFEDLRAELVERRAAGERSFSPTADRPWIVLVVDEATSLLRGFTDKKQAAAVEAAWRVILSQGRSLGIVCIAAGQEATKEALGLRDLFPARVAGRLANSTETGLVLGPDAVEAGASPHSIPVASPANGYATAGLAYIRTPEGQYVRCRFPYVPDDVLTEWAASTSHEGHEHEQNSSSPEPVE